MLGCGKLIPHKLPLFHLISVGIETYDESVERVEDDFIVHSIRYKTLPRHI